MSSLIIYRGLYGPYTFFTIIASLVFANVLADVIDGKGTYENSYVYDVFGLLLAAVMSQIVVMLSRRFKPKLVIDTATGDDIRLTPQQTLFMIPIKVYPFICAAGALVCLVLWLTGHKPS